MMDIEAAAKKHAADLMDKLTEKRCAHMSDLVDAFRRALTELQPKNVWGVALVPAPSEDDGA